jgi:hypothetical protein
MTTTNKMIGSAGASGSVGIQPIAGSPSTTNQPSTPSAIVNA